jgi:hypothetical protein
MFALNGGVTFPLGLDNITNKGSVVVPPLQISADYGIANNIVAGVSLGYSQTQSATQTWEEGVLSQAEQAACAANPDLAASLGIDCSANGESGEFKYQYRYLMLGVKADFYFKTSNPRLNFLLGTSAGYKIVTNKIQGNANSNSSVFEQINRVFYSADIGVRYMFTPKWGAYFRGGYGSGYGDNVAFGLRSILFSVGATYQIVPPKAWKEQK